MRIKVGNFRLLLSRVRDVGEKISNAKIPILLRVSNGDDAIGSSSPFDDHQSRPRTRIKPHSQQRSSDLILVFCLNSFSHLLIFLAHHLHLIPLVAGGEEKKTLSVEKIILMNVWLHLVEWMLWPVIPSGSLR